MNALLARIDANKAAIDQYRPMEEPLLSQLRAYYRVGLTWSSNALEGSSLTESETKVLLEDGLTVGGKPIRDYYEATGHAEAYDAMFTLLEGRRTPTEGDILLLHRLFYSRIDEAQAGKYRSQRVFITGSAHTPPPPANVPGEMEAFPLWMRYEADALHPVVFAAQVHKRFVFIHPFIDGNGRVARLLMNLCLLRAGYTLAIVPPILRGEYIQTLEQAHADDAAFTHFIAERVLETQKDILRMLKG
ncbi:MAG: Fic family protein [Christensenellaceae bacterium]|jgi:Fic family protein|nr:Fic family protein [Christensenellaceae bacterium]